MTNILSYSRFTPVQAPDRVADYDCCLPAIIAAKELFLPGWEIHIAVDQASYDGFWFWQWRDFVQLRVVQEHAPSLIQGMLWRLQPVLPDYGHVDTSIVAFRDLDSVILPSEATALIEFERAASVVHGICDSYEHGVPFLGGLTALNVERLRRFHPDELERLVKEVTEAVYGDAPLAAAWHRRGLDQELYAKHFEPFIGRHDLIHNFRMSAGLRKRLARMNASVFPAPLGDDEQERRLAGHCGAVVSPANAKALYAHYVKRLRWEGKRDVAASLVAVEPV